MTPLKKRRRAFAFLAVALAGLGLAIPLHIGSRDQALTLTAALVRAAGSESFLVNEPITLLKSPRVVLESGTVSVAVGDKPAGSAAILKLLADGRARLQIDGATIAIGPGPDDVAAAGASPEDTLAPILAALADLKFATLSIKSAVLVRRDNAWSVSPLGSLVADFELKSRSIIVGKGTFERSRRQLAFETSLTLPSGHKSDAPLPLRAKLSGEMLAAELNGNIQRGREWRLVVPKSEVRVPDLKALAEWLGAGTIDVPGFREFTAKGPMEWTGKAVSFQSAHLTLDGNAMRGSLAFDIGGARPMADGTLAFETLDLAPYMPGTGGGVFALASSWMSASVGRSGKLSALIPYLDADLRISAAQVSHGPARLGRGAASVEVKGGRLHASITEMELEQGGHGDGQIDIDLRSAVPRYSVSGQLREFNAGSAGQALFGWPVLDGPVAISGQLAAAGLTADALLSSLQGKFGVTAPEGAEVGLGLEELMAMPADGARADWANVLAASSRADALSAKLTAEAGRLSTEAVDVVAGDRRYVAAGTVDLGQRTIDMTVTRRGTEPAGSSAARSTAVRIKGPLAEPAFSPAPAGDRAEAQRRVQ